MYSFQSLCSLLLCNALVVAAQRLQKVPEQEENVMRIRMPQTLSRGEMVTSVSKAFIGINISICSDNDPSQKRYLTFFQHLSTDDNMPPDGHYVPRILFVDPSMTVRADLTGKYKNRMYAYELEDISN
ncbi:uncharacterized protein RBU57_011671 [Macrochelys suwanniensis]